MHFFECKSYVRFHMYIAFNFCLLPYWCALCTSLFVLVLFSICLSLLVKPFTLFERPDCNIEKIRPISQNKHYVFYNHNLIQTTGNDLVLHY